MSIFGFKGDLHNLSKGAFDSVSVVKPGTASLLLAEYMPKSFDDSFAALTRGYKTVVEGDKNQGESVWQTHIKPGLKKAGGFAWELAKPVVMDAMAVAAGMSPTAAALVASAETMLTIYLQGLAEPLTVAKTLVLNKGEWVFIEKEASLRRRRRMKGEVVHAKMFPEEVDVKTLPKAVEFGFYIRPAYNDPSKVTVFNIDAGITQNVDVRQVRRAGSDVAQKVEQDEQLSVVRELFFYKSKAVEFASSHPKDAILPGRNVVFKGEDYMLIETNGVKALLEDIKGRTKVVAYDDLSRGVGKSTPGHGDDFFDKSNGNAIYAGQWVMAPARPEVQDQYGVDKELAVIFQIEKDGKVDAFYCMDGKGYRLLESQVEPFPPNFQSLYSSKQPFKLFKLAATEGDMEKTTRFELGSKYVEICLNEYEHTLKYLGSAEPPEEGPEKKTVSIETDLKVKVGNTTKDKVDAREELIAKTGLSSTKIGQIVDEAWDDPQEYYGGSEGDTVGGDGILLGAIAVGALLLIGMGGAAAAI